MLSTRLGRVLEHIQERNVTILASTHTGPYSFKTFLQNNVFTFLYSPVKLWISIKLIETEIFFNAIQLLDGFETTY